MSTLKERWKTFGSVVFDPWTIILIIGVVALFVYSRSEFDATSSSLVFVLITLASSVLGGRVTKHWVDIIEGGIVVARGKSAIRSLKLLLGNISSLERRITNFIDNDDEIQNEPKVIKRNYEEIVEICNLLQEETVNSIENWTDIIPEADISSQIGVISDLKNSVRLTNEEISTLNGKLEAAEDISLQEKESLKSEIRSKEKQIGKLNRQITDKKLILNYPKPIGLLGGLSHLDPHPLTGGIADLPKGPPPFKMRKSDS